MADYSGTYDGVVVNNRDPLNQQRVTVNVPQVLGSVESNWAYPSAPTAFVPSTNDSVLVQFVGGDPAKPIYVAHGLDTLNTNVNQAQTTANNAQSAASSAQTSANNAQSSANSAQSTANSAQTAASNAQTTANNAQSAASAAQTTANGKNTVYYASTAPTGGTYKTNDVWYDTSNGYLLNLYINGAWTASALGHQAIQNIDAATITVGQITGAQISATAIDGKTITGATFQSASSGHRWVLSSNPANSFQGYAGITGTITESSPGAITVDGDVGSTSTPNPASWVSLTSGQYNNNHPNSDGTYATMYSGITVQTAASDTNPRPGRSTSIGHFSHQHYFTEAYGSPNAGASYASATFIVDATNGAVISNVPMQVPGPVSGGTNKTLGLGYVPGTYKSITANTGTFTTVTKIAGLSGVTHTNVGGRYYKVCLNGMLYVATAGNTATVYLYENGVSIQQAQAYCGNLNGVTFNIDRITGTSGACTYDVYVSGGGTGGGGIAAGSAYQCQIWLEDMGSFAT